MMVLKGSAPVSMMRDYQTQVTSYTKGRGRLFCSLKGYAPCQNQEEIVEEIGSGKENAVLYVGRLADSPKKVDRLLNVWKKVQPYNY